MVDLTISINDENNDILGEITIYQDGSDAEATTRILQWIAEEYEVDQEAGVTCPLPINMRVPEEGQERPRYRRVTDEEREEFQNRGEAFLKENNPANMFKDCRSTTLTSIMEFLANGIGATIYDSAVGKPLVKGSIR